uniref:Uncharacterized protein n=1 Tax=Compsopogon caeruleus TaxID=31354 RepID=A0A7S1TID6_9RHOD|mmetsp:Transcript_761/g.1597  ORF Transcript_761/g.1597 Transcript_761/m.1597 type:complete len:119 (+) Transcript_761:41-397(+)
MISLASNVFTIKTFFSRQFKCHERKIFSHESELWVFEKDTYASLWVVKSSVVVCRILLMTHPFHRKQSGSCRVRPDWRDLSSLCRWRGEGVVLGELDYRGKCFSMSTCEDRFGSFQKL